MKGLDFASVAPSDATFDEDVAPSESEEEAQEHLETDSETNENDEAEEEESEEDEDEEAEKETAFEAKDFVPIGEQPKASQKESSVKADVSAESDEIPGFVKKSGLANTENASITVRYHLKSASS